MLTVIKYINVMMYFVVFQNFPALLCGWLATLLHLCVGRSAQCGHFPSEGVTAISQDGDLGSRAGGRKRRRGSTLAVSWLLPPSSEPQGWDICSSLGIWQDQPAGRSRGARGRDAAGQNAVSTEHIKKNQSLGQQPTRMEGGWGLRPSSQGASLQLGFRACRWLSRR